MKTDAELKDDVRNLRAKLRTHQHWLKGYERVVADTREKLTRDERDVAHTKADIDRDRRALNAAQWALSTGHRPDVHEDCQRDHCMICEGGLTYCTRCGGFEGSLLPTCPERHLTMDEHDANYAHFCDCTGPFAKKSKRRRQS